MIDSSRARVAATSRGAARPCANPLVAAALVLAALAAVPGCSPPELVGISNGLDSLRVSVDNMNARDTAAFRLLQETRREMAEQRDILLSTKATSGTTTQEMFEQMERLNAKLEDVLGQFKVVSQRNPTTPAAANATQIYDQGSQDLAQGRYPLALQNFRDVVRGFPTAEVADNAQYGVGESFFAQSMFDSAAVEYALVDSLYPQGDKVPAALYKLALSREKLGRTSEAKQTLEALVRRYPQSGEAQLARERLGTNRKP